SPRFGPSAPVGAWDGHGRGDASPRQVHLPNPPSPPLGLFGADDPDPALGLFGASAPENRPALPHGSAPSRTKGGRWVCSARASGPQLGSFGAAVSLCCRARGSVGAAASGRVDDQG